ncbi:MAG: class II glutamine amidotransferase [Methanobacteriaceae archaeon]|nr:class II glutamine amidotransferase [Methanobacteriaceae archaeon]
MCELLGICFANRVNPKISFRRLCSRASENPHGWGLALYPDQAAMVIKEPLKGSESQLSDFLEKYPLLRSRIFLAHVRNSSQGGVAYRNTHPFTRELQGREYVFAHNGTLTDYQDLELGRFQTLGDTDSEYIFCYLLKRIEEQKIDLMDFDNFSWLKNIFRDINCYGPFNCFLSDGENLFTYRDQDGARKLHYLLRKTPYTDLKLKDDDFKIEIREKKKDDVGYLVATNPLTDEDWQPLKPGELLVFRRGELIFQ